MNQEIILTNNKEKVKNKSIKIFKPHMKIWGFFI